MKNQQFADKIKEDISKSYDVIGWTFFFNSKGDLEFYNTEPGKSYIYKSDFKDYDNEIKDIAERIESCETRFSHFKTEK